MYQPISTSTPTYSSLFITTCHITSPTPLKMGISLSKHRRRRSRATTTLNISPGVDPELLRERLRPLSRTSSPPARYQGLDAHPNILASISQHADERTLASMMQVSHSAREAAESVLTNGRAARASAG